MQTRSQVMFWGIALVAVTLVVMALRDVLMPFLVGLVIAYALNPLTDRLQRLGLSRLAASAVIVGLLVVLLITLFVLLVPLLLAQAQQLIISLPQDIERLRIMIDDLATQKLGARAGELKTAIDKAAGDLGASWSQSLPSLLASLVSRGQWLIGVVSLLLITPLVVFYLLVDWPTMLDKIAGWLPRAQAPTITRLAADIDRAIAAFIRGQGVISLILTLYYTSALTVVGIRYSLLLGVVSGVLSFVPFIGWTVAVFGSLAMAAAQFWPSTGPLLMVLLVFAIGQAIDAAYLSPQIVGTRIGLHPVWMIMALAVFSTLFGFVGVLVAVPMAAAAAVLVRHALSVYLASPLYDPGLGRDAQPRRPGGSG